MIPRACNGTEKRERGRERVGRLCIEMLMRGIQDSHLALNHAVEIIGKVDGNLNVKVQAATDWGTNVGEWRTLCLSI